MAQIALLLATFIVTTLAAPLFGNVLGDATGSQGNSPVSADQGRCPNGGTWISFSDDFSTNTSEWTIETGHKGVSYSKDGVKLSLEQSMASAFP